MENEKDPKWYLNEAVEAGRKSLLLLSTYGTDLKSRLKEDEEVEHTANVNELGTRISGQKQTLVVQKSSTQGQESVIESLNNTIVDIRNIVRNNNPSKEISVAFGVGDRISRTVSSVLTAGNIILDANTKYAAWSKDAGIIASDITEVTNLMKQLTDAEKVQDDSVYVRKAKTMDKNALQRAVEDEVSRLSSLGIRQFSKNAAVIALFDDLIPAAHKPKPAGNHDSKPV